MDDQTRDRQKHHPILDDRAERAWGGLRAARKPLACALLPLADTKLLRAQTRPARPKFTTIGQWYWGGGGR